MLAIDHIQLAAPPGCEEAARRFFGELLGLEEIPKPEPIRARGGVWFRVGAHELHIGVDPDFAPARKAHPASGQTTTGAAGRLLAGGVESPTTTRSPASAAASSPIRGATGSS